MEDTKELSAKATDSVEQSSNKEEAFDNVWYDGKEPTMALEKLDSSEDLLTRISSTYEPIEGEELMPEATENWWTNIDDANWEWMFPTTATTVDNSKHASCPVHDAQEEEKGNTVSESWICGTRFNSANNDNQEVFCVTDETGEVEEPSPKAEDSSVENTEGIDWEWIDPSMDHDSNNDNSAVPDAQADDTTQRSHITFNNWVGVVQDTFQELNSTTRGDIRSPSEITPIRGADSWSTSSPLTEDTNLRTVRSITSSQVNKCPFFRTFNNASQNPFASPDLITMLKELAAKLRDLAGDINILVGRLAVQSPSDAWIDSVFSTTRSVNGSIECKTSLSSNASSASNEHEKDGSRDGSWDNSEY